MDSRPVRAATQAQLNDKAMKLMREVYDPEWPNARTTLIGLQEEVRRSLIPESSDGMAGAVE